MILPKFLKHNNITVVELKKILGKNGVDENLKFITKVPLEWQELVNGTSSIIDTNLSPLKNTDSKKILKSFEALGNSNPAKMGPISTATKIKKSHNRNVNYFLGYVKFIALDGSHGFVYKIDDPGNFYENVKKGNHQLARGFKNIRKGDVIICKQQSPKSFKVKFESNYLEGLVTTFNNHIFFTDFKINDCQGIVLNEDISNLNLEEKVQLEPIVNYNRKLEYTFGASSSITVENIKFIDAILREAIFSPSLSDYQLSIIKWCLDIKPNLLENNANLIDEHFKIDIENKNNIPLQKLIHKWSLLKPGSLFFKDVYTKEKAFEFIAVWANNEIQKEFIGENLYSIILDLSVNEENKLTLKNIFYSLSLEKKTIIQKCFEENKREDKDLISQSLTLLGWLNTDSSFELSKKIFFESQKDIQIQLYLEELVVFCPTLTKEEHDLYLNNYIITLKSKPLEDVIRFIEKWKKLKSNSLKYNFFEKIIENTILFKIWSSQTVNYDFFEGKIIDVLDELYKGIYNDEILAKDIEVIPQIEESDFQQFPDILLNEISTHIHEYCANLKIGKLLDYEYYISFLNMFQTEETQKEIINLHLKTSPQIQYQLWTEGKSKDIPEKIAIRKFNDLTPVLQSQLINVISIEELNKVLKNAHKDITKKAKANLFEALCVEINKFLVPIVFDIELRDNKITEVAWTGIKTANCTKSEELKICIEEFSQIANNDRNLVIGHNIIDFDCPLLEESGVEFHENSLWDTLLIESILSPELQTLSLNTGHNAIDDCENTLQLFYNQVCRCIILPENEIQFCLDYLPEKIASAVQILKSKYPVIWLEKSFLLDKRDTLFLPQPKQNNLAIELNKALIKVDANTLIVGPELIMPELFKITKLDFHNSKNDSVYKKLSDEGIRKISNDKLWVKQMLKSYLNYAKTNSLTPLKGGLAPFVYHKIKNEIDFETILDDGIELSEFNYSCTFINVNELSNSLGDWKNSLFENLIIIAPDLISTSNAELITTLNIKNLFDNDFANEIWMQFSGGQSFQEITRDQCQKLGVSMNSNYSNLWLEKFEFGSYRLYGHYNWEDQLDKLNIKNRTVINQPIQKYKSEQLVLPKIKNTSKTNSKIVRLNPETIFRKQYWVYQKELINSISLNGKPIILFVPREEEIGSLEQYFSSIGYYIPNNKNSISRKIEKLFLTKFKLRLLVARINDIKFFAQKNHHESLNFVIDSFSIQQNFHNALGSNYLKDLINKSLDKPSKLINEDVDEIDSAQNVELQMPSDRLGKDTFLHLKLQKPAIDYIRGILSQYDSKHTLWILDPRVNDYPDFHKQWDATSKQLSVWKDESRYEDEIKQASIHIQSPEPLKELPISIEKIKKALSNSFLNGNSWYDYQDEYLDKIIPSKEDLLVSLPTGAGKSLLFQAPSLFKSSFTNKLSIVVTPLKALMEDQVKDLWNKGFINNVEYINSDRKSDISMIYRSIAGGELSLLYITPERFRSNGFINALKTRIKIDGSLEYAIFDEAHCVSQWGHDFRPDYLNSAKSICTLRKHAGQHSPILLFSATVSEKIYNDFNTIFI